MVQAYSILFLGMPLTAAFQTALNQGNSHLYDVYLKDDYLRVVNINGVSYIGKFGEEIIDFAELIKMQDHIYSLLRNIAPEYAYKEHPLELVPYRV